MHSWLLDTPGGTSVSVCNLSYIRMQLRNNTMKSLTSLFVFLIGICLGFTGCAAATQPPSKVLLAQTEQQPDKIAQVKNGTLKTANASWWGFDKTDATEALQNAISSGVPKLIVDTMGSDWIVNKPIQLVSNQQIVFQDGVVIQAKKGMFKGKKDPLFDAQNITNIQLIGEGNVTFRMHREDYGNPKFYDKAEWRHGISLRDCSDVVIRGLTVEETGGDGLYLGASAKGYNKNVLVENCNFDKNYRQGISVISAQDLIIRNCKLRDTAGTEPQFGIDVEPNSTEQRIVNCVLENCELSGNKSGGLVFSIGTLKEPVSVTLNKCLFVGNGGGLFSTIGGNSTIVVNDCIFDHQNITLRNTIADKSHFLFKDCVIDYTGEKFSKVIPINITDRVQLQDGIIGGVTFDHTIVKTSGNMPPIRINFKSNARTAENGVAGDLLVENDKTGNTTKFDLASLVQSLHANLETLYNQQPATVSIDTLQPPATPSADVSKNSINVRNKFAFLQYAKSGETITINLRMNRVYERETTVELLDPKGAKLQTYTIPIDNKTASLPITFTAQTTGIYRLVREQNFTQLIDLHSNRPGNGFLIDAKGMQFMPNKSKLYFEVPAGIKQFTIGIAPDDNAVAVLTDSHGKEVVRDDHINSPQPISATREEASHAEIWSLEISSPVRVLFYKPLLPVVSTDPGMLLLQK